MEKFDITHNEGRVSEHDEGCGDDYINFLHQRKDNIYIYGWLEMPYSLSAWKIKKCTCGLMIRKNG